MITLKFIQELLTIEDFNDLVTTEVGGDVDWIQDMFMLEQEDIDKMVKNTPNDYRLLLLNNGVHEENWPYDEWEEYCNKVKEYLKQYYIVCL